MNFLYSSFGLDYQNPECDFLNINLDEYTRLFVDAYAMSRSSNKHMQYGSTFIIMKDHIWQLMVDHLILNNNKGLELSTFNFN